MSLPVTTSKTRGKQLSDAVFAWLKAAVESPTDPPLKQKTIAFDANVTRFGRAELTLTVLAYPVAMAHLFRLSEAMDSAMERIAPLSDSALRQLQAARRAFRAEYVGDAATQFQNYLLRCWESYAPRDTSVIAYPYVAIVQSAGFGKSRMLQQLAEQTKSPAHTEMKVLYTCVDAERSPVRFPRATPALNEFFFFFKTPMWHLDRNRLVACLYAAYVYAIEHWDSVGDDWFPLFLGDEDKDREVAKCLESRFPGSFWDLPHITLAVKAVVGSGDAKRVLVLAVDEARDLLGYDCTRENCRKRFFSLWREALSAANSTITLQFHWNADILAVFVDSPDSDIVNLAPSSNTRLARALLLSPFVLLHIMDVHLIRQWLAYQTEHGPGSCSKVQFYKTW